MKCLKLKEIGSLILVEMPIPETKPDEILIKVSHCALCRTDAKMWQQGHRDLVLPRVLGHEICGHCEETGKSYIVWPGKACGICQQCLRGAENLCSEMRILGFHKDGGFAEFVSVPKSGVIAVPEELPGHLACLAEPLACTLNVLKQAKVSAGKKVLIYGGGPVGLLMALAVQTEGAEPFILEISSSKLRKSEAFRRRVGFEQGLECKMSGFDVVVNAAPSIDTLSQGLCKLAASGCFCLFSGFTAKDSVSAAVINEIHYRQLQMVGAYGCTYNQMERALQILLKHREAIEFLIEKRIGLEQVPSVMGQVLSGQAMKFVVELDKRGRA